MTVLYCMSHITKSLQWKWFSGELKNQGIKQVYVIIDTANGEGRFLCDDLKEHGLEVYFLPHTNRFSHLKNIWKTVSVIRKHKVDIVHTSLPFGNLVGQIAARIAGIRNRITTCENASWAHDFNNKKQEWIDKMTFRSSVKIIANSEISAEYLRKHWNFDKSKLEVIYHGWKPSEYNVSEERKERLRLQLGMNKEKDFIIGVLARFEFWKGYDYIIEAANLLKDQEHIKFYVFGHRTPYFDLAMKKIRDFGLSEKVIYNDFIVDSPALYQLFDIHLHVPVDAHIETGGLTIIDGMMAARPQILTLSGYAYQIARHMENAYVVPYKDASAIAQGILWVKENYLQATALAQQARKDAVDMFGIQVKVSKHMALYNQMVP